MMRIAEWRRRVLGRAYGGEPATIPMERPLDAAIDDLLTAVRAMRDVLDGHVARLVFTVEQQRAELATLRRELDKLARGHPLVSDSDFAQLPACDRRR